MDHLLGSGGDEDAGPFLPECNEVFFSKQMNKTITIDDRTISDASELFITAEIGVTCNHELDTSKKLIDVVAESGADAAKFIIRFPEEIFSKSHVEYEYETASGVEKGNLVEIFEELRFTFDEWNEIKNYADEKGVITFATASTPSAVQWADELGFGAFKISSWDVNNIPLLEQVAQLNKPLLIDTGPAQKHELARVLHIMEEAGNEEALLVHCYHTDDVSQMNMKAIPYMRETFHTPVGFSSPDKNSTRDIMAVSMGACFLEKRLTLSNDLEGHHHYISLEPDEFNEYVSMIRDTNAATGEKDLIPSAGDLRGREKWFRSIVANEDIPEGTELDREMLAAKRPPDGVSPVHIDCFDGLRVNRDIEKDEPINWNDLR